MHDMTMHETRKPVDDFKTFDLTDLVSRSEGVGEDELVQISSQIATRSASVVINSPIKRTVR